eukprot:5619437-Alexandrium_andersonii.AAC.1
MVGDLGLQGVGLLLGLREAGDGARGCVHQDRLHRLDLKYDVAVRHEVLRLDLLELPLAHPANDLALLDCDRLGRP